MQRRKIYLAAPLFSRAERDLNELMTRRLEERCDVFLPQRDGALVPDLIELGHSHQDAYRLVFNRDTNAIKECDAVVINLDGRAIDEGAAFELGYAFALEKECVGYHTDVRVLLPWGINPMIQAPLIQIFNCMETLEAWAGDFASRNLAATPRRIAG